MAHCVISAIVDTDDGNALVPACVVHAAHAPCMHDGEPANPLPLHAWLGDRDDILRMWQIRTRGQRPLVIHQFTPEHGPGDHGSTSSPDCWCGPEILPAEEK